LFYQRAWTTGVNYSSADQASGRCSTSDESGPRPPLN
jgi:hypothetical protein